MSFTLGSLVTYHYYLYASIQQWDVVVLILMFLLGVITAATVLSHWKKLLVLKDDPVVE